jgi:hypothetical protein
MKVASDTNVPEVLDLEGIRKYLVTDGVDMSKEDLEGLAEVQKKKISSEGTLFAKVKLAGAIIAATLVSSAVTGVAVHEHHVKKQEK